MRWWLQLQNQDGKFPPLVYCLWSLIYLLCYLLSCRVTVGHSVKLSNSSQKLPQIAFQKRENVFVLHSDYSSGLVGAEKWMQGIFTLVFLLWPAPYLTIDIKSPPSNIWKLLRYLRVRFVCAETPLAEMTLQNLAHAKTQLSLRKRSSSVSGKPILAGVLWTNLRDIVESNKKLE